MLDGLLSGALSFKEVEEQIGDKKTYKATEECFLKEIDCKTWEEAQAIVPNFAKKENLRRFKMKGNCMPKEFVVSCHVYVCLHCSAIGVLL